MSASDLVVVFSGNDLEARMVWSRLEGHGIDARLLDQHLGTIAPWQVTSGGAGAVKVVVAAHDVDKAKDVLNGGDI